MNDTELLDWLLGWVGMTYTTRGGERIEIYTRDDVERAAQAQKRDRLVPRYVRERPERPKDWAERLVDRVRNSPTADERALAEGRIMREDPDAPHRGDI